MVNIIFPPHVVCTRSHTLFILTCNSGSSNRQHLLHSNQSTNERCWSWSGRPRPTTLQPPLSNGKTRGS